MPDVVLPAQSLFSCFVIIQTEDGVATFSRNIMYFFLYNMSNYFQILIMTKNYFAVSK